MSKDDLIALREQPGVSARRLRLGEWLESSRIQFLVILVIVLNAVVLGLETSQSVMRDYGVLLKVIDRACLVFFVAELAVRFTAYRGMFWRSGWNVFDLLIVGIALVPGVGPWAVLRSLRVLRVLRLLTVVPQLRRVVAAFLHAIPGLLGVIAVMVIFFYTAGVLATGLFGGSHPQWFGDLGRSLFTLFQIMTLESWSMGIVRPVMEVHPWAWGFFIPFIVIATFTILNLFIGIIVSTMQELSTLPDPSLPAAETRELLESMEKSLRELRQKLDP